MVTCHHCQGIERQFDRKTAERDLRRFRRRGALRTTRLLIDMLRAPGVEGATLLDVGGGIGAIHHLLLDAGAREVVHVDVSPAYLEAARSEAARRGHIERARFIHADFVAAADELSGADIVTLDRVICCYPDMEPLVGLAADKACRVIGAVYPRETWWMRVGLGLANLMMRLQRSPFRVYLHSPTAIDAVLRQRGFEPRSVRRTIGWHVEVYARRGGSGADRSAQGRVR
ncbi:MAG TPA: class I SAM-dependent methyltransferase [Gemmatimonadaceae bacterium]|nr:class I SAM-dependent methyltransferase [Gemmatimonadaceae bacterium]